jgi:hypothetical protein
VYYYYIVIIFLTLLLTCNSIVFLCINNHPALANFTLEHQQLILPQEIYEKHWTHSHEEDHDDIQVYRPSTFNFPLSRGRIAFEIEKSGIFIQYGIGPDDTRKKVEGNWTIEEPNTIRIDFADKSVKSYKMNIVSYNNNTLLIKKILKSLDNTFYASSHI